MFRKILAATAALTLGLGGVLALAAPASATPTDPNADHKVTICHRTGSTQAELKNGYNEITVDIASSGYVKGGHTGHEQVGNGPGPDIIPAYEAFAKVKGQYEPFSFPGKDLDYVFEDGTTGAEFLANGCQFNNPKPDPKVETEVVDRMSCDLGVEERTVTTTTPYIWDGEEWVLDYKNAVEMVGDWSFVRDLTEQERNYLECDPDVTPANPEVDIQTYCGVAIVDLSNPRVGAEQGEQEDAKFTIVVDGVATTDAPISIPAGYSDSETFRFAEDSGLHEVRVYEGEQLIRSATVESDCEPPVRPEDKVEKTEWVDGKWKCDDTTVEQTREVTTTSYTLRGDEWVADEPVTVTETRTRDLTDAEQTVCPTDDPPKQDEPEEPVTELPHTGAGQAAALLALGLGLVTMGGMALMASRRRPEDLLG